MNDAVNKVEADDKETASRTYPDVFTQSDILEDGGEELGGAIADATEDLPDTSVFALVTDVADVKEGWNVIVDRRDAGAYKDKARVLVYQLPTVETLMKDAQGMEFVEDAVTAAFGRKIGAVARGTLAEKGQFLLPQEMDALVNNIRTSARASGKKRLSLRGFRAVAGGVIKSLNAAYAKNGVAIRFDTNGLKACLADSGLAEAQHGSLPEAMWSKIFDVLEGKIKEFVATYVPKEGDEKAPKELDLEKELAQLKEWKATRDNKADAGDITIDTIDF